MTAREEKIKRIIDSINQMRVVRNEDLSFTVSTDKGEIRICRYVYNDCPDEFNVYNAKEMVWVTGLFSTDENQLIKNAIDVYLMEITLREKEDFFMTLDV